ncbi:hypothetical protein OG782_35250 [Streptomyces sp. NBC_00876]|uniref:hypothetical protein n=1 Tax=Streptomyces sp. NBC_00876 TaxID=2975853 RepID=UPI003863FFD9|nr:hypothetical protein OG782_35250 [Streptomyces sp. NBC_00876]
MAHEPENRPGTDVAAEPVVVDLEGIQPSAEEVSTASAEAGRQDREAPDLPDPVDGPAQSDPAQVNDAQKAQADLDAGNAAAQEAEEPSDDTPSQNDLESDNVASAGTAPPLESDGDADEPSDTRSAPLDGLGTSPGNDNSAEQEDQASDRIQTDEASETGDDEPPGPSLTEDGEEDSGAAGDHTESDEAARAQDTKPPTDSASPNTQPNEADEASSQQVESLGENRNSPSPQDSAADGDPDDHSKPIEEESLQKELEPEHHIEPPVAMTERESNDISASIVEEKSAPGLPEPAESTGAPDLPESASHESQNFTGAEIATGPEVTDLDGVPPSSEQAPLPSAEASSQDREVPDLPDPVDEPAKADPAPANYTQKAQVSGDATGALTPESDKASDERARGERDPEAVALEPRTAPPLDSTSDADKNGKTHSSSPDRPPASPDANNSVNPVSAGAQHAEPSFAGASTGTRPDEEDAHSTALTDGAGSNSAENDTLERTEIDGSPEPNQRTDDELYAFGNKTSPRPVRLERDLHVESEDQTIGPFAPNTPSDKVLGASTFIDHERAPLSGKYLALPPNYQLSEGLGLHADGEDVGGPEPWGHRTIYPTQAMSAGTFRQKVAQLDWEYRGDKPKGK